MIKPYKKYAIARSTTLTGDDIMLVSLLSEKANPLIATGYHSGGYTTPDFLTFDTTSEAKPFLAQNQDPERSNILGVVDKVIEVENLIFTISISGCFKQKTVWIGDHKQFALAWFMVNAQRDEDLNLDMSNYFDCPWFRGSIVVEIKENK